MANKFYESGGTQWPHDRSKREHVAAAVEHHDQAVTLLENATANLNAALAHPGNALPNTQGKLDPDTGAPEDPMSPSELNAVSKAITAAEDRAKKALASRSSVNVKGG